MMCNNLNLKMTTTVLFLMMALISLSTRSHNRSQSQHTNSTNPRKTQRQREQRQREPRPGPMKSAKQLKKVIFSRIFGFDEFLKPSFLNFKTEFLAVLSMLKYKISITLFI